MQRMKQVFNEREQLYSFDPVKFVAEVRNKRIFPTEAKELIDFFQSYQSNSTLSKEKEFIINFYINVSQMIYLVHSKSSFTFILSKRSKLQPLDAYLKQVHQKLHLAHENYTQSINFFYFDTDEEKIKFSQDVGFFIEIIMSIKEKIYAHPVNLYPKELCFYLRKEEFIVDCLPNIVFNVEREMECLFMEKKEYPEDAFLLLINGLRISLDICQVFSLKVYLKSKEKNLEDLEFKKIIEGVNLLQNLIRVPYISDRPILSKYIHILKCSLNQLFVDIGKNVLKKEEKSIPIGFKFWTRMKHETFQSMLIELMHNFYHSGMPFSIGIINIILEYLSPREINRPERLRKLIKVKINCRLSGLLKSKSMTYKRPPEKPNTNSTILGFC